MKAHKRLEAAFIKGCYQGKHIILLFVYPLAPPILLIQPCNKGKMNRKHLVLIH